MVLFGNTGKNARMIGTALLVITFVAGALAGAAVIRVVSAESRDEKALSAPQPRPMRGSSRRLLLDDAFAREIGLTTEQRTKLKSIFDRRDVEAKQMWDSFEPQLKQFGQQVHAEVREVLTPEQQAQFDAAIEKRRGERKKRDCAPQDSTQAKKEKSS